MSEYLKFFNEDVKDELQNLKNRKSNLVMNLKVISKDRIKESLELIAILNLQIAIKEIERGIHKKARTNIISSLEYLDLYLGE